MFGDIFSMVIAIFSIHWLRQKSKILSWTLVIPAMLVLSTSLVLIFLSQFQKQARLRKSKTFKKFTSKKHSKINTKKR
jgi:hypothetical protein